MDFAARLRLRRRTAVLHHAPAFDERGLMLGRGTVLLPFTRGVHAGHAGSAAHDRLLALLAVAASGRVARDVCKAILPAMHC